MVSITIVLSPSAIPDASIWADAGVVSATPVMSTAVSAAIVQRVSPRMDPAFLRTEGPQSLMGTWKLLRCWEKSPVRATSVTVHIPTMLSSGPL